MNETQAKEALIRLRLIDFYDDVKRKPGFVLTDALDELVPGILQDIEQVERTREFAQ